MNHRNDEAAHVTPAQKAALAAHLHEQRAKTLRWYLAAATVLTLGAVWEKLRKGRKR
jgi:hypothetical protein